MQGDHAEARLAFAQRTLNGRALRIDVASADASFRSYWRVDDGATSWIVMDAPPAQEDVLPWLDIGARLRGAGLHAPEVLAADLEQGFVLMEDLGIRTYLPELNENSVDALYGDALDALLRMQRGVSADGLPVFAGWVADAGSPIYLVIDDAELTGAVGDRRLDLLNQRRARGFDGHARQHRAGRVFDDARDR